MNPKPILWVKIPYNRDKISVNHIHQYFKKSNIENDYHILMSQCKVKELSFEILSIKCATEVEMKRIEELIEESKKLLNNEK